MEALIVTKDTMDRKTLRTGEVVTIKPDGHRLEPDQAQQWLATGTLPTGLQEWEIDKAEHVRTKYLRQANSYTHEAQERIQRVCTAGLWILEARNPYPPFSITPTALTAYRDTLTANYWDDSFLHGLTTSQQSMALRRVQEIFAPYVLMLHARKMRDFWQTYGYETNAWGPGDLNGFLCSRMDLTEQQAQELLTPEYEGTGEDKHVVRQRTRKVEIAEFISTPTIMLYRNPSVVNRIKRSRVIGPDVIVESPV